MPARTPGLWIMTIFVLCFVLLKLLPSVSLLCEMYQNSVTSRVQDQDSQLRDAQKTMDLTETPNEQDAGSPQLNDLRIKGPVQLPTKEVLKSMPAGTLNKIFHSYLDNTDILCHRKLRMGRLGDGGWEICDDVEYRPRKPCLVYSFGINFDFSFDDDTTRLYQCPVFSFDPSMKMTTRQRTPLNMFLQIGISGTTTVSNKGWNLQTLDQLKKKLNHTGRTIDVLKMDVEEAEWEALPQMIRSGELSRVRQLLVEYHEHLGTYPRLALLKDIYDIGFRKFYVHKNPQCKGIESQDTAPVRGLDDIGKLHSEI